MEDVIERRIQFRGSSFVLTIPQKIAQKMNLKRGQSVRFILGNDEFTVRPTSVDDTEQDAGYERSIDEMIRKSSRDIKA